jgi:hypothetical protein
MLRISLSVDDYEGDLSRFSMLCPSIKIALVHTYSLQVYLFIRIWKTNRSRS